MIGKYVDKWEKEQRRVFWKFKNIYYEAFAFLFRDTDSPILSYNHGSRFLAVPFEPEKICMMPSSGRIYHPGPSKLGGIGLISDKLGILWTSVRKNFYLYSYIFLNQLSNVTYIYQLFLLYRSNDLYLMKEKKIHQLNLYGKRMPWI